MGEKEVITQKETQLLLEHTVQANTLPCHFPHHISPTKFTCA